MQLFPGLKMRAMKADESGATFHVFSHGDTCLAVFNKMFVLRCRSETWFPSSKWVPPVGGEANKA